MQKPTKQPRAPRPWAWLFFLLTLIAAYVFFALPHQLGERKMQVEFVDSK